MLHGVGLRLVEVRLRVSGKEEPHHWRRVQGQVWHQLWVLPRVPDAIFGALEQMHEAQEEELIEWLIADLKNAFGSSQ